MSNEFNSFLLVFNHIGGDWRVMGDLLDKDVGLAPPLHVGPATVEQPAEKLVKLRFIGMGMRSYSPSAGLRGLKPG